MKFNNLITIDGLSGAGKGTLALNLAHEFNYGILDSGALYRLVGLVSQRMDSKDPEIIEKEIGSKKIAMNLNPKLMETEIFFGTENVTKLLKSDEIANEASNFAADKKIRVKLSANINKLDYLRVLINKKQKIPSEVGEIILEEVD